MDVVVSAEHPTKARKASPVFAHTHQQSLPLPSIPKAAKYPSASLVFTKVIIVQVIDPTTVLIRTLGARWTRFCFASTDNPAAVATTGATTANTWT